MLPRPQQKDQIIQMEDTKSTETDVSRYVLVVHTAVCYDQCQGLGVGLVQRVACAKNRQNQERHLGDTKTRPKSRARGVCSLEEKSTQKGGPGCASQSAAPGALHGQKALAPNHHINDCLDPPWPPVQRSHGDHHTPHRTRARKLQIFAGPSSLYGKADLQTIQQIRAAGFKVSVQMSDHHDSDVQLAAAQEAERMFKRACRNVRKHSVQKAPDNTLARTMKRAGDTSVALPIREYHAVHET